MWLREEAPARARSTLNLAEHYEYIRSTETDVNAERLDSAVRSISDLHLAGNN